MQPLPPTNAYVGFDRAEFRATCQAKLALYPPKPERYTKGFLSSTITPLGAMPLPGSVLKKCDNCPDPVLVGPEQQRVLRGDPLVMALAELRRFHRVGPLPVLCLPCIGALCMADRSFRTQVIGIGVE